jgi:hypothetical protein
MNMPEISAEQKALLQQHQEAAAQLAVVKARESELRKAVLTSIFALDQANSAPEQYKGTHYAALARGYRLKAECSLDYKVRNEDGKLDDILEKFDATTADLLVSWEPKLSVSTYKKLSPEQQALFAPVLTIKNSSPSISIVAPKQDAGWQG